MSEVTPQEEIKEVAPKKELTPEERITRLEETLAQTVGMITESVVPSISNLGKNIEILRSEVIAGFDKLPVDMKTYVDSKVGQGSQGGFMEQLMHRFTGAITNPSQAPTPQTPNVDSLYQDLTSRVVQRFKIMEVNDMAKRLKALDRALGIDENIAHDISLFHKSTEVAKGGMTRI